MNRALDVAIAGAGLVVTSPFLAAGALAVKLQDGGPVLYRQMRVGTRRRRLRAAEAADDDRRCGNAGRRVRGGQGRRADHEGRAPAAAAVDRRAAAALERRARRDVRDRPAADPSLPGRQVRREPAPPPRREARHHRLGADPRPRVAAVGGAHRARPLVRAAPGLEDGSPDPPAHPARPLRRHLPGRDRAAGAIRRLHDPAVPSEPRDRRALHVRRTACRHRLGVPPCRCDDDRDRRRRTRPGALPRRPAGARPARRRPRVHRRAPRPRRGPRRAADRASDRPRPRDPRAVARRARTGGGARPGRGDVAPLRRQVPRAPLLRRARDRVAADVAPDRAAGGACRSRSS